MKLNLSGFADGLSKIGKNLMETATFYGASKMALHNPSTGMYGPSVWTQGCYGGGYMGGGYMGGMYSPYNNAAIGMAYQNGYASTMAAIQSAIAGSQPVADLPDTDAPAASAVDANQDTMAGAAFAVGIKTKDKDVRAEANAATLSACLGISEPAMYGINLPRKTPFYATIIASGIGGVVAGLLGVRFYAVASASFVGLPATIGEGSMMGVVYSLIVIAVSFISAFIFTIILGKKDLETNVDKKEAEGQMTLKGEEVLSPLHGELIELSEVKDKTFASGAMGKGVAIKPVEGILISPVNGHIEMIFNTKHAIGLKSDNGAEILIHIGMDTVNLQGKYFEVLKNAGDNVKVGDELIRFDIEAMESEGYDVTTPIIVTNSQEYVDVIPDTCGEIKKGSRIFKTV